MNDIDILKDRLYKTKKFNESKLHLDMKLWSAMKFYNKGISVDKIYFEEKLKGCNYNYYTIPDVLIFDKIKTAIYCQTDIIWAWTCDFIEKKIPILKNNYCKIIVVVPNNISGENKQEDLDDLKRKHVKILRSPYEKKLNSKHFSILLDGLDISKLIKLQRKSNFISTNDFVIHIIKKYIKNSKNKEEINSNINEWLKN